MFFKQLLFEEHDLNLPSVLENIESNLLGHCIDVSILIDVLL